VDDVRGEARCALSAAAVPFVPPPIRCSGLWRPGSCAIPNLYRSGRLLGIRKISEGKGGGVANADQDCLLAHCCFGLVAKRLLAAGVSVKQNAAAGQRPSGRFLRLAFFSARRRTAREHAAIRAAVVIVHPTGSRILSRPCEPRSPRPGNIPKGVLGRERRNPRRDAGRARKTSRRDRFRKKEKKKNCRVARANSWTSVFQALSAGKGNSGALRMCSHPPVCPDPQSLALPTSPFCACRMERCLPEIRRFDLFSRGLGTCYASGKNLARILGTISGNTCRPPGSSWEANT